MSKVTLSTSLLALLTLAANAQSAGPAQAAPFEHIILIIQENRTPDNLFGASGIPGADVTVNKSLGQPITIGGGTDLPHKHSSYLYEVSGQYLDGAYDYVKSGAEAYWDIAAQYGFANRMFQTNQGPSFPAHQFLLSGTSAPADSSDLFVSDNALVGGYGCDANPNSRVPTLAPDGTEGSIYPCFQRSSLLDLLDAAGVTWRYYSANPLWNAPNSLAAYEGSTNLILHPPSVLSDIRQSRLANVSWVTPAAPYSDHPGTGSGGPPWVASIVNAVGQSPYWANTAIIVTWDDWGGWWDHVTPVTNQMQWCTFYCYGFRVPMLVISARTPAHYVDNDVHDFGSILRFVESNFGLRTIGPGGWADSYADDLSVFFTGAPARKFVKIKSRRLTAAEVADHTDPDSD